MLYYETMIFKNSNKLQIVLDEFVAKKEAAGLNLLVCKDGKEIGYWESGLADVAAGSAYSRDTIVRLYSMSKPVTAVAAMILMEEGKLDFAEELYRYLPEFSGLKVCTDKGRKGTPRPAMRPILISDLLNMTSGYTYGAWSEDCPLGEHLTSDLIAELNKDQAENGPNKITTREVAHRLSEIPVSFEPGTDYNYGLSADILGTVIEEVAVCKLSDFMKERIFKPLGMNDTDFYVPDAKQSRLAKVYRAGGQLFTSCNLGIQDKMNHQPAFESGGAGLCSTVDDYMKFALMLTNGGQLEGHRILSENTVRYLSKARLMPALQQRFDMKMPHLAGYTYCNLLRVAANPGSCNVITNKGEFGWDGWLGPYVSVDLESKITIVMTMQRCDSGTTGAARKARNIIYSSYN
jgi:CubicO group peptidase (beta-lactamase class C family)